MDEKVLEITKNFHDTYEKLSKEYDYETREDTKVFNVNSNNGKLMYATVNEVISPILKENQELKQELESEYRDYSLLQEDNELLLSRIREIKGQQKAFIKYLEWRMGNSAALKTTFEMILLTYKSIIRKLDEKES